MILLGLFATFLFILALLMPVWSACSSGSAAALEPGVRFEIVGDLNHPDVSCQQVVDHVDGSTSFVCTSRPESAPRDLRRQQGMTRRPEVEETMGGRVGDLGATLPAEQDLRRRLGEADDAKTYNGDTGMSKQD